MNPLNSLTHSDYALVNCFTTNDMSSDRDSRGCNSDSQNPYIYRHIATVHENLYSYQHIRTVLPHMATMLQENPSYRHNGVVSAAAAKIFH